MLTIRKKYVLDEQSRPIAVQIDIETFRRIEEALEDYGLLRKMKDVDDEPRLSLEEARKAFSKMRKKK